MSSAFKHSPAGLTLGSTRTLLYGPVTTGVTSIVFSGTFTNMDNTNHLMQYLTLETYDGTSTYTNVLNQIPVPFGSASKCPKVVLYAGESLYGTSATTAMISASISILERS